MKKHKLKFMPFALLLLSPMVAVEAKETDKVVEATTRIEMEDFSTHATSGVSVVVSKKDVIYPNSKVVKGENGGWFIHNGVDFGKGGIKSVVVRSSSPSMKSNPRFIIREGGRDGEIIADVKVLSTNIWDSYIVRATDVNYSPKGVVDLYFEVAGGANVEYAVDWIEFSYTPKQSHKCLVDFFLPVEPQSELVSTGVWGNSNVLPRDINNGIEGIVDRELKWCYWDGGIVKDDNGKYHLYCSRWGQEFPHSTGWKADSKAIHAVSDNIMGPYKDTGLIWEDVDGGKAHNVFGFRMTDGRYGVVTSEITDGKIFASDSPEGPFELLGNIELDVAPEDLRYVRYSKPPHHMSNVQVMAKPDGKGYRIICRSTAVLESENSVLGPYKLLAKNRYYMHPELAHSYNEDPTMWYSGGLYHTVYNHWPSKISHHFASKDGVNDWVYMGEAFNRAESKIFIYTDGTINDWEFIERPTVYVAEDGHPTHFIFSVIDVGKGADRENDNHASKIFVVPFDGKSFDKYMSKLYKSKLKEVKKK